MSDPTQPSLFDAADAGTEARPPPAPFGAGDPADPPALPFDAGIEATPLPALLDGPGTAAPELALADAAARELISSALDHTLFVEAGAGSGKTSALVDRVEALVRSGVELDHIAAITFTDKAASELRDRIRQRFEGDDDPRARRAVEQLDGAAIGTLHAFAQRILGEHPVEARLPPGVEVLDEIGSQIDFEDRWRVVVDQLLDDESLGQPYLVLTAGGVDLPQLRELALAFGANWDLVAERIDLAPRTPPPLHLGAIIERFDRLDGVADACTDADDKLLQRLRGPLRELRAELDGATDEAEAVAVLRRVPKHCKVSRLGRKDAWTGDIDDIRQEVIGLGEAADALAGQRIDAALWAVAAVVARFTLDAAEQRRTRGRLEFHDLLVRARRLLRDPSAGPGVRRALRHRYRHLLLDEFQDTDPIQVELAVLIACPDDVTGRSWDELTVDSGRLFFVGDPKQSIYRFRRADIEVFLAARRRFGDHAPHLTTNFRSSRPVIRWVNQVFGRLIRFTEGAQPEFEPLDPARGAPPTGPGVAVLGADAHTEDLDAAGLRAREASEVADTVVAALAEGWSVDRGRPDRPDWERARPGDICILLPARTSLAALERALSDRKIPYRAETSSLVYATREVRDLLLALRAIADPTDELALVAALRSAVYGCGDDDLAQWRLGLGGRFSLGAEVPEGGVGHPVGDALVHLGELHQASRWSTPAELLDRLIRDRGVMESAVVGGRPRDVWRRLRFVVDQARAWADAGGTQLRSYLRWAALQGADHARVSETVLPETDDDSVRILTVHGAKGLEFPITILSGMTTRRSGARRGVVAAFPSDGGAHLKLGSAVASEHFAAFQPIDEQLDAHEHLRLLYVAATRARDHLVVSLHRSEGSKATTAAAVLAPAALDDGPPSVMLRPRRSDLDRAATPPSRAERPSWERWSAERAVAIKTASRRRVVAATTLAREAAEAADPGLAKRERDLELPPWNRGRYGTAVGRAVHGVLQVVDLATGAGLADAARAQAEAEGVAGRTGVVERLAGSALATEVARAASRSTSWRELWVAAPLGDELIEGYVDLLYRSPEGLVIVDWKTDYLEGDDDARAKLDRYRLQGASYAVAVEAAAGEPVARVVFAFLSEAGAVERDLDDLAAAMAEVRSSAAILAARSGSEPDD